MKKLFFSLALSGALFFSLTSCSSDSKKEKIDSTTIPEQQAAVYQCPMKCEGEKTYDKPGKCPVCGMDLKQVESIPPATPDTAHSSADSVRAV